MREIVTVDKSRGRESRTKWTETEFYCMHCGSKSVWMDDLNDFYVGYGVACVECLREWSMPDEPAVSVDSMWEDRVKSLVKLVK